MSIHHSTEKDNELAKIAYASVREIATVEVNDRNRLGYHVWLYLRGEVPTLRGAIEQARSRYIPKFRPLDEVEDQIMRELSRIENGEVNLDEIELFPMKAH
jgi:hypothetical protein